jgi:hypothetical protein
MLVYLNLGFVSMYKKFVIGLILLLFMVVFSGCNEQEIYDDTDKIELLEYSIVTKKYDEEYRIIGNGFIHSDEAEFYLINGTVINIADEILVSVNITAKFYNNKNNLLTEKTTYLGGIPINNTREFGIYYFSYEEYFEDICGVKFEFEVL